MKNASIHADRPAIKPFWPAAAAGIALGLLIVAVSGIYGSVDANLDNLMRWVAAYETREDEYGLKSHRSLFEAFKGKKREYGHPEEYQ